MFLVQFWFMLSCAFRSAFFFSMASEFCSLIKVKVNIGVKLDPQGDVLRDKTHARLKYWAELFWIYHFDVEWDLVSVVLASGFSFTPQLKLADHGLGYLQE